MFHFCIFMSLRFCLPVNWVFNILLSDDDSTSKAWRRILLKQHNTSAFREIILRLNNCFFFQLRDGHLPYKGKTTKVMIKLSRCSWCFFFLFLSFFISLSSSLSPFRSLSSTYIFLKNWFWIEAKSKKSVKQKTTRKNESVGLIWEEFTKNKRKIRI